MNIMEQLKRNPVLLYGIAGVFAGNLLGGSKKSRASQAVVYGSLGAAIGWFVNKGNQQQQKADISKVIAIESAATAEQAATVAADATDGFGVVYLGRAGRPPRGSRAYHRARRRHFQQQSGQSQGYTPNNGYDDGGAFDVSMTSGLGVGMM